MTNILLTQAIHDLDATVRSLDAHRWLYEEIANQPSWHDSPHRNDR